MNDDMRMMRVREEGRQSEVVSKHNEAGRGMELSELVTFNGAVLTVDDRSGIVFELVRAFGGASNLLGAQRLKVDVKVVKLRWVVHVHAHILRANPVHARDHLAPL